MRSTQSICDPASNPAPRGHYRKCLIGNRFRGKCVVTLGRRSDSFKIANSDTAPNTWTTIGVGSKFDADSQFGGGSSVCGGVEPKRNGHKGAVTIDLRQMGKVKEIDETSRAALIEGGTYGPALEAQLRPHGLTLRHFPQCFEYSTLSRLNALGQRLQPGFASGRNHFRERYNSAASYSPNRSRSHLHQCWTDWRSVHTHRSFEYHLRTASGSSRHYWRRQ